MLISYSFLQSEAIIEIPDLYSIVYNLLKNIPRNKVTSYGEIAKGLGDIRAARTIGRLMAKNIWYEQIPCYKVVHSDGKVGKYSRPGGENTKIKLLEKDDIPIEDGKIINLNKYLWTHREMHVFPYLQSLKRIQQYLSTFVIKSIKKNDSECKSLISCDVAYVDGLPDFAIATCVLSKENKVIQVSVAILPVFFPYIPGYLAFREIVPLLSALQPLLKNSSSRKCCILIDGHGILHPRKFGIASHVGLILGKPTIGIAKKLLTGKPLYEAARAYGNKVYYPIIIGEETLGYCIKKQKSKIFVSPGAFITLEKALKVVLSLEWRYRREPSIMMIPHDISNYFRKNISKILNARTKEK